MAGSETAARGGRPPACPPRWDLSSIFAGFDDPAYEAAMARDAAASRALAGASTPPWPPAPAADWLLRALALEEEAQTVHATLESYVYARFSTATRDARATLELGRVEELALPLKRAAVLFRKALAARRDEVLAALADPRLAPFAFHLEEEMALASRQMDVELEDLAADLLRSGGDAWGRLQEAVYSNTGVTWDPRTGERKTLVELRTLAYDAERATREKAYRLELEAWRSVEIPLAAALNGVKGFALSLDRRRTWPSSIDRAVFESRMTRKSLDALLGAMEASLPDFRRYLGAKARALGLPRLAFYDLFAPLGPGTASQGPGAGPGPAASAKAGAADEAANEAATRRYTWAEARDLIPRRLSAFDPAMGAYAARAFDEGWIDAEPREGKIGGAYCTRFPLAGQPRVLCNFDGGFSDLTTLAHELGHAWHYECVRSRPAALQVYPMTLAETASIFAETLVFEAAMAEAAPAERLGILESRLQDSCQVIVDILSRYRFESAVFERRARGELPAEELCSLMAEAQRGTYGDALDPGCLHPYMWAVKAHYYSPELSFYNFPYAFGLLFGLALYARRAEQGQAFAAGWRALLAETGSRSAVMLGREAGFDLESEEFWAGGLALVGRQIDEFEDLVDRSFLDEALARR